LRLEQGSGQRALRYKVPNLYFALRAISADGPFANRE